MKIEFKKLVNDWGLNIAKYCFAFFVIIYAIANILMTVRQYNDVENIANYHFVTPLNIIIVIILLLMIYLLIKKDFFGLSDKKLLIIFLTTCLFVGLYWIFTNHQELIDYSDDYNCLRAARLVGSGDYGPLGYKTYINTYPHNLSLVSYFMIYTRLFQENANIAIRLVNLVFVLIGYYSLYKIGDELFNNSKVNKILVVLMFLSMQFVFYAFIIYGNVLSYSLALLSIYQLIKYLKNEKLSNLIVAMLAIAFSCIIKNNSLIVFVAELIYLLLHIYNRHKPKLLIVIVMTILLEFAGTNGVVSFWAKRANYDYANRLPRICWIAYGFNYDPHHPGGYMNEFELYHYENGFNPEFTEAQAKIFIDGVLESFKERPYLIPRFVAQKFLVAFANPEYETFASYRNLPKTAFNESVISGDINDAINLIWDATSTIVALGLVAYVFIRFKKMTLLELIGAVVVFGGFLFHSFWEVKAIYTYQYYMYLLPYAAYGIYLVYQRLGKDS